MPDNYVSSAENDRPRVARATRCSLTGYALVALLFVGVVCLWPVHVDQGVRSLLLGWLDDRHTVGLPRWADYAFVESAANVLLYVPFGLVGAALMGRSRLSPLLITLSVVTSALVLSSGIELIQYSLLAGRTGDPRDVLANTIGAMIGASLLLAVRRLNQRRRTRTSH